MLTKHPELTVPDENAVLWRYVDLAKLLFLLERRALWLSRLDILGDPYEGVPPKTLMDSMWAQVATASTAEQPEILKVVQHNSRAFKNVRKAIAVSCWHANPVESAAMWNLYAKLGEGIAIRTTFRQLQASVKRDLPIVWGGLINYVDFETFIPSGNVVNVISWAALKRTSFSHEQEFRLITLGQTGPSKTGFELPVDLNTMIEAIYVSPTAPSWYPALVAQVCSRYEVKADVRPSQLLALPSYMQRQDLDPLDTTV